MKNKFLLVSIAFAFSINVMAQSDLPIKHHVIIMMDRSGSMGLHVGSLDEVFFNELNRICFLDTTLGRPLLIPGHGDYLSIVSHQLKDKLWYVKDFTGYIATSDNFGYNKRNYGYIYKQDFGNDAIFAFHNTIHSIGYNNFFGGEGYPTISIPFVVDYLSKNRNQEEFNKIFIVKISDGGLNIVNNGVESVNN
jgi:hypothetical protein